MPARNPADLVLRSRYRQTVLFPDLTERLALRLSSILTYTARAHFGAWHKKMGGPDFTSPTGVFTPLVVVELEVTDVPVTPWQPFLVRGETHLAKTVDERGAIRHLVREGRHAVYGLDGALVARPTSATSSRGMTPIRRAAASPACRRSGGWATRRRASPRSSTWRRWCHPIARPTSPTSATASGTTATPTPTAT